MRTQLEYLFEDEMNMILTHQQDQLSKTRCHQAHLANGQRCYITSKFNTRGPGGGAGDIIALPTSIVKVHRTLTSASLTTISAESAPEAVTHKVAAHVLLQELFAGIVVQGSLACWAGLTPRLAATATSL